VTVVDLNAERVDAWNSPHLPIHEAGLPKIVRIARDGTNETTAFLPSVGKSVKVAPREPNLVFTTDVKNGIGAADVVLICVNTPTKTYGIGAGFTADLSAVEGASETVARYAKDGAIIVEKSTVPTGTARMIREIVSLWNEPSTHAAHLLTLPSLPDVPVPSRMRVRNRLQPRVPCRGHGRARSDAP
jgi:UDPglucose 6-dehydrogenase